MNSSVFQLRPPQVELDRICQKILEGQTIRSIMAAVTPGGGKSALPVIAAHRLIRPGFADRLCWVAPRKTLLVQAEREFLNPRWNELFGRTLLINRIDTNSVNPSRGTSGYAVSVQCLVVDTVGCNQQEFDRFRYVLVLDECHHLFQGGRWAAAVQPLIDRAFLTVFMTGSTSFCLVSLVGCAES